LGTARFAAWLRAVEGRPRARTGRAIVSTRIIGENDIPLRW